MKAAALIKEVRESTQHLYDSYQNIWKQMGKWGCVVLTPICSKND